MQKQHQPSHQCSFEGAKDPKGGGEEEQDRRPAAAAEEAEAPAEVGSDVTTSLAPSLYYRQVKKAGLYKGPTARSCRCSPVTATHKYYNPNGGGAASGGVRMNSGDANGTIGGIPAPESNVTYVPVSNYRDRLVDIRQTFPQPVSDRCHDAYLAFTIMRALDKVDSLKSKVPVLGKPAKNDYKLARQASLSDEGETVEEVNDELVRKLEGVRG